MNRTSSQKPEDFEPRQTANDRAGALPRAWHALRCRLGFHRSLNVIQSYGAAQHIGCPRCGVEMAIHHGQQAVIPWSPDVEQMYRDFGYDTAAATACWQKWRSEQRLARAGGQS